MRLQQISGQRGGVVPLRTGAIAVTGANRGIGAAIARELATRGWPVACLTRSGEPAAPDGLDRSEEHTSELQSLMRISYAVFCLKKKKQQHNSDDRTQKVKNTMRQKHH